ncbi:hypothetical protein GCM10009087_51990 [Sphingomonas oligophenolica]|uniref:TrbI/VirB10 family protein n=1 Tax=Sphingomonas oligophenolica TaxID=301154 RepID=A0ABU9Y6X4_9SPHN
MKLMYRAASAALVLACAGQAAAAGQTTAPAVTTAAAPVPVGAPVVGVARPEATPGAVLPSNTELLLRLNSEVNSKKIKVGQRFDLTVANDVMLGTVIVIPRGTPAVGEVTYRTGKGAFGKSAKIEVDMRSIQLGGQIIPITGHYREEGNGNTGAAVGAVVAVGVFGAFVTGHSAILQQGREFKAFTTAVIPVVMPATPTS